MTSCDRFLRWQQGSYSYTEMDLLNDWKLTCGLMALITDYDQHIFKMISELLTSIKKAVTALRRCERYYEIRLQQDLLGDWVLIRLWGGLDSKRGHYKCEVFTDTTAALAAIKSIAAKRLKNGYKLV